MPGEWKEVARLRFKGDRFRDHALDLSALTELRQFQKMVAETAKALWRAANPDRRLPGHFEERTRLCLRRIVDGSATAPLEVYIEERGQAELWEPEPVEVNQAIKLAYEVFDSIAEDRPLPDGFPKQLIPEYAEWGKTLGPDEEVEFQAANGRPPVKVNVTSRERLARFAETPHESTIDVTGEVLEADVRQRRFQVWIDPKTAVFVGFDEAQEDTVTSALKDHRSVRIRVRGRAEVSPQGKPLRFTQVDALELIRADQPRFDPNAPAIEEELARIAAEVPESEWAKLPDDLTDQLDHYIYGTPKE